MNELMLPLIPDFELGSAASPWSGLGWKTLTQIGERQSTQATRFKAAWSGHGLYFLIDCEDAKLTCSELTDFDDLYNEDVVEIFLWPDEAQPLYFEYELSPLGKELTLLVPNNAGTFMGWRPWHYTGERRVLKAVCIRGGPQQPGAAAAGWTAEIFIPSALLTGLGNTPPHPGASWRANVYRIDYDEQPCAQWAWAPVGPGVSRFHNYSQFGRFRFGGST
jgi:hypothetical protein